MKTGVLLLWSACLLATALGVLRFAFAATPQERLLTLALVLAAAHRPGERTCAGPRDGGTA